MNLYDFDKTIFDGESSSSLYFFLIRRHPQLFFHVFVSAFFSICKGLHIISTKTYKEKTLGILKHIKNPKKEISAFCDKNKNRVFQYYLETMQEDDVVCSASPEFLVKEMMQRINPKATIIASQMNIKTGKFESGFVNCKGEDKIKYLKEKGFSSFDKGFSDSNSDKPMLSLCEQKYRVVKGKIKPF